MYRYADQANGARLRLSSLARQLRDTLAPEGKTRAYNNLFLVIGFVIATVAIGTIALATQSSSKQPESSGDTFYGQLVNSIFGDRAGYCQRGPRLHLS